MPTLQGAAAVHNILHGIPQGADDASDAAAAGVIQLITSEEATALMASWAHQVTTIEEHGNPIAVHAHDAQVLVLFLTVVLRFTEICAGCSLRQHVAFCLHNLVSQSRMHLRTSLRATSWQSAVRKFSKHTVVPACSLQGCACLMNALTHFWEGFLERVYRVLLSGGAACFGLQQGTFEHCLFPGAAGTHSQL